MRVQGQTQVGLTQEGLCVCGAPGKPVLALEGGRRYVCSSCFSKEVKRYLSEAAVQ